jgi:hypothetical protein
LRGYVHEILPAYNILQAHLTERLRQFESYHEIDDESLLHRSQQRSMLEINTMNAQRKLNKYRALLVSPVYPIALMLLPWVKWTYLESASTEAQLEEYKKLVQAFYDENYANLDIGEPLVEVQALTSSNVSAVSALYSRDITC